MPAEYDPRPIPESIRYNGSNANEVVSWATQTLDHYERPHLIGYSVEASTREMFLSEHHDYNHVHLLPGQSVTYTEGHGLHIRQDGPEILVRDHPMTVAEAQRVQDAQRKLGVGIPEPGEMDFVNRRAAATNLSAPTITDPAQVEAMQRHPSNALIRRSVAERYGMTDLGAKSLKPVPPRIRPV